MIKGIDHVAIAVENLDDALSIFENVLGLRVTHRETIEEYDVEVATIEVGDMSLELVQGTAPDSPITSFIKKRGPGIHHVALEVENIEEAMKTIGEHADMIDAVPRTGKDDSRVAFIHPRSMGKILFELVQNKR